MRLGFRELLFLSLHSRSCDPYLMSEAWQGPGTWNILLLSAEIPNEEDHSWVTLSIQFKREISIKGDFHCLTNQMGAKKQYFLVGRISYAIIGKKMEGE
jgi:hypothetical protein